MTAPRLLAVLELVLDGKSNKHIAHILDLKVHTIENYVSELLGVTGAESRAELISKYLRPRRGEEFSP